MLALGVFRPDAVSLVELSPLLVGSLLRADQVVSPENHIRYDVRGGVWYRSSRLVAFLSQLLFALRRRFSRRAQLDAENLLLRQQLIVLHCRLCFLKS